MFMMRFQVLGNGCAVALFRALRVLRRGSGRWSVAVHFCSEIIKREENPPPVRYASAGYVFLYEYEQATQVPSN